MRPRFAPAVERLEVRDLPSAYFDTLPVLPGDDTAVLDHVRGIAALGRALGRQPGIFLKVGDSNTEMEPFRENGYLRPLGSVGYNPVLAGLQAYGQNLVDTWGFFRQPTPDGSNSFARTDSTAYPGAFVGDVFARLGGEIGAINPSVALVMLGTNEALNHVDLGQYRNELSQLLTELAVAGVVPILSTVPDNIYAGGEFQSSIRVVNQVIADVAADRHVPLWNLFRQEEGLANGGLDPYGTHLSTSSDGSGIFAGLGMGYGQTVHNLGALAALDWYRRRVVGFTPAAPTPLPWTPIAPGEDMYAVGRDLGQAPVVSVFDSRTGKESDRFLAFEPTFDGGVRAAVGDVTGDGIPDVVATPGPGGGPVVKVFSGADGSLTASFFAFEPSFRTGQTVALADLDSDGAAEIIVGAGARGGPAVAVYHGRDFGEVQRFFAFDPGLRSGVSVAASANLAGFGPAIVVGAGAGGGPVVEVFRFGENAPAASFLAFAPSARGGVNVAAGDLDGDGFAEIVAAPAAGSPNVRIFDAATGTQLTSYVAGAATFISGTRVAVMNGSVLAASGLGDGTQLTAFHGLESEPTELPPTDSDRAYGLYVG